MTQQQKNTQNKTHLTSFTGPSLTQKQFGKQANINTIMRNYQNTGIYGYVTRMSPNYQPEGSTVDRHQLQNTIAAAKSNWEKIPTDVRAKFNNNLQNALNFIENPENREESIKLGLIPKTYTLKKEPEIIQKVQIIKDENTEVTTQKV